MSEYALYEGDTFITMGTLAEISKEKQRNRNC